MGRYTSITIIYNPNSTGSSQQMAQQLRRQLRKKGLGPITKLVATKHAGHAETLAYELVKSDKHPLIISSSGDGGYHEVINGTLRAQADFPKSNPTTGLLPAGNANDHASSLEDSSVLANILAGNDRLIDTLKLTTPSLTRYAHSYIGLGVSPAVGHQLNKTDLNLFNELIICLRVFVRVRRVKILVKGRPHRYASLIFSNIDRMAKILTLAPDAKIDDGKFEVSECTARNKLAVLRYFFAAATAGLQPVRSLRRFEFQTTRRTKLQLDGEIVTIPANAPVAVSAERQTLRTVL